MATSKFGSVRKQRNGRWQARFTGPDGARYPVGTTFSSKTAAVAKLAGIRASIEAGTWAPPGAASAAPEAAKPLTFKEFAEAWIRDRPLAVRTVESYTGILKNHLEGPFGALALGDITPAAVRAWHARPGVGPVAKSHSYSLLRTILGEAVRDKILDSNPCNIRGGGVSKTAKRIVTATPAEVQAIADVLPARLQLLPVLGAWCSLRFGELSGLQRRDVDLDRGVLHVERGVVRTKAGLITKDPKTKAGIRTVTVPPHVLPAIREHLKDHVAEAADSWLFPADRGGPLSHSSLQRHWNPAVQAAGKDGMTPHCLRHSGQTWAALSGANLRELMGRAGQTSPGAALRYLHDVDGRQAEIAARMSALATSPVGDAARVS